MKSYLFGHQKRVYRASLNLRIVLLFLFTNVNVILVRAISEQGFDDGQLLFAAMVRKNNAKI